jgi:hypothetical protein
VQLTTENIESHGKKRKSATGSRLLIVFSTGKFIIQLFSVQYQLKFSTVQTTFLPRSRLGNLSAQEKNDIIH